MGKKKSRKDPKDAAPPAPPPEAQSGPVDPSVFASVLALDYPLLDPSLIFAILLDYEPSELGKNEQAIRDQLGVLEATSVPDHDDPNGGRTDTNTTSYSDQGSFGLISHEQTTSITDNTDNTDSLDDESPQDEIDFLKAFFPNLPQRDLEEALSSEPTLEAAIDHLLSVELINNVGKTGHWPDEPESESDGGAFRPALSRRSSRSPTKKAVPLPAANGNGNGKKKKPPTITIPVVDTMQRRTASGRSTPVTPAGSDFIPASSTDVWAAYASLTETLAEIVPRATPGYFKSYLHSGDYESAHAATMAALNALAASNARLSEDLADEAWQIFEDTYGVSRDECDDELSTTLHACIGAADGDVMSVMDLMNVVHDLRFWPDYEARREAERDPFAALAALEKALPKPAAKSTMGSPPKTTRALNDNRLTRPVSEPPKARKEQKEKEQPQRIGNGHLREAKVRAVPGSKALAGSAASATASADASASVSVDGSGTSTPVRTSTPRYQAGFKPSPVAWTTVNPKKAKRGAHPLAASIPAYTRGAPLAPAKDPEALTPAECYARGAAARLAREEAMRAAGRHFRSGQKHIKASVAGHYAAQAREAASAAREWELRGARLVVNEQLEQSRSTIDLHHMSVDQAVTIAKETAGNWAKTGDGGVLVIITGKGIHSAGHRGVLGPAVQRALVAEGYRVTKQEGYLAVRCR